MRTKLCKHCNIEKPVSLFNKSKKSKDGFRWCCKECDAEYNLRYRTRRTKRDKTGINRAVSNNNAVVLAMTTWKPVPYDVLFTLSDKAHRHYCELWCKAHPIKEECARNIKTKYQSLLGLI